MTPRYTSALVTHYGGDEDQQIAALLHDVLEDGGPQYAGEILGTFGARVLGVVEACTDGVPDTSGQKAPWAQRKEAYLDHLGSAPDDVLLVSGCDKLSNARAIVDDLLTVGPIVFERFNAGRSGTLWYYTALARLFAARRAPVHAALDATVAQMLRLASSGTENRTA
jgi:(p)ppGpp synthase/HD superfamily hydrolase